MGKRSIRKSSIRKPKFGIIFAVRFAIALAVFSLIAVYLLKQLDDKLWYYCSPVRQDYLDNVVNTTTSLAKDKPGSEDYYDHLTALKLRMAIFQMTDRNYAEVCVGDLKLATDKDTAFMSMRANNDEGREFFFIEDISYLDPVNEYMNGKFDFRAETEWYLRYGRDPVAEYLSLSDILDETRIYSLETAYVNHETKTFIPGVILITYKGNEYRVDCTPDDTKGFEYVSGDLGVFIVCLRADPDLNSDSVEYYYVHDVLNNSDYPISADKVVFESLMEEGNIDWYVAYNSYEQPTIFEAASFACAFIIVTAVVLSLVISLVLAIIRYQKDKTVWKIFEYRTKTTEAMAHDLKTPLAAIAAYAESIESAPGDAAKTGEFSRKISDKVSAMDHMVEDMLALSRSETGKVDVCEEDINVKELIVDSLKDFPDMKAEIKGDDVILKTDRKLFKQSLDNLISNCYRYREDDSVIDICIDSGKLTISNKTSMTYEDVDSLKKPFVKGEDSRGNKGTGLGLAIAENNLSILRFALELASEEGRFQAVVKFK